MIDVFESDGIKCEQANADADALIVKTAVACLAECGVGSGKTVAIVGEDTDLYCLALADSDVSTSADRATLLLVPPSCIAKGKLYVGDKTKCTCTSPRPSSRH